jgi:hypothetical protein
MMSSEFSIIIIVICVDMGVNVIHLVLWLNSQPVTDGKVLFMVVTTTLQLPSFTSKMIDLTV